MTLSVIEVQEVHEVAEVDIISTNGTVKVRSTTIKPKKKKVRVYLTRTSLPSYLLTDSLKELGFRVDLIESSFLLAAHSKLKCDLLWCGCEHDEAVPAKLQNRIPAMKFACRKGPMCQLVNLMHELFPGHFTFLPMSWPIPSQYAAFCHYAFTQKDPKNPQFFILKPDEGSQGDGIYLFKSPMDITQGTMSRNCVVQNYIHNPLLIENYKFDLRLYVLISKLDPLEAYLCKEGLARFCTEKYEKPSTKNLAKSYMHLTNYSVNKYSSDFNRAEEESEGSKRTVTSVMKTLEALGHDTEKIWTSIKDIVFKTLICIAPLTKVEQLNMDNFKPSTTQHFHLLGFDILLDENLNPFLLEINGFPSMRTDSEIYDDLMQKTTVPSPVDEKVKKTALKGALHILFKNKVDESYCPVVGPEISDDRKPYLIFEDCRKLFTLFLKKSTLRKGSMLGSSGFRSFVRSCKILRIIPSVTNADMDLLYISIIQQSDQSSQKCLSFLSFYRLVLTLAVRKFPDELRYLALKQFIDLCFANYAAPTKYHFI